jgi:hypothetical protein
MTDGAAGGKLATDVLGHYGGQQQEDMWETFPAQPVTGASGDTFETFWLRLLALINYIVMRRLQY